MNRDCERFYDEGEDIWPRRYAIWGRLVAAQPGQIAWIVFDAPSLTRFMPSLYPPITANSPRELAAALGPDQDAFERTVTTFNDAVVGGHALTPNEPDGNCTRGLSVDKTNWAQRIETAPFHAYPVRPGITFTYLGVRVNEQARMLMDDGNGTPSENLFASGEIMAGNVLGEGYAAGIGMTIGSVFGRIAGTEAARHVD